jgi:hypothetical protein
MIRKRTHEELHEMMFEARPIRFNTATSLKRQCITDVATMHKEYLYKDKYRRIFRPRIELTEEQIGHECEEEIPEAYIAFDVYLTKKAFNVKLDKAEPPYIGEKIKLFVRSHKDTDIETEREVDVEVIDRSWGSHIREVDEGIVREYPNNNLGFIMTQVKGSYSRSLCIPPAYIKKRNIFPIGR